MSKDNWEEKCKCGHTKGVHGGGASVGCEAEGCDCTKYRKARKQKKGN